jgi:hypothetical protein
MDESITIQTIMRTVSGRGSKIHFPVPPPAEREIKELNHGKDSDR